MNLVNVSNNFVIINNLKMNDLFCLIFYIIVSGKNKIFFLNLPIHCMSVDGLPKGSDMRLVQIRSNGSTVFTAAG
jgi:hypothetical protein